MKGNIQMHNRVLAVFLGLLLSVGMAACGNTREEQDKDNTLKEIEYTGSKMDEILNDQSLFGDKTPAALDYNWMWFKEEDKVRDDDDAYSSNNADGTVDKSLLDQLKKVDWDNDGIDEYCYCGNFIEGLYFDMAGDGDILTVINGYGPYGMGWNDVAYFDDAYWIYSSSGNMSKVYEFERYNGEKKVEDSFALEQVIGEYKDEPSEDEFYRYEGKDSDNKREISKEEFDRYCGDNGFIYAELPDKPLNMDEDFTKRLYEAIKEFYEEKRPALSHYGGIYEK